MEERDVALKDGFPDVKDSLLRIIISSLLAHKTHLACILQATHSCINVIDELLLCGKAEVSNGHDGLRFAIGLIVVINESILDG